MVKATNPYVRATTLHGMPILGPDGTSSHEVQDVIVDDDGRAVSGFSLRESGVFGKRHVGIVKLSAVTAIGPDALMVKEGAVEDPPAEDDRLASQLAGSSVVTQDGVEIGRITDLVLETRRNRTAIAAVEIETPDGSRYLALEDGETLPADVLVVRAGAEGELADTPEGLVAKVEGS